MPAEGWPGPSDDDDDDDDDDGDGDDNDDDYDENHDLFPAVHVIQKRENGELGHIKGFLNLKIFFYFYFQGKISNFFPIP